MPFGRLSPVSETDSESLHSGRAASVDLRPRPLNFSRPKPQDLPSARHLHHDTQYAHSTSSSSGSSRRARDSHGGGGDFTALPDEPRFDDSETDKEHDNDDDSNTDLRPSLESNRTNSSSLNSELVWDPQSGELRSKPHPPRRGSDFDSQRSAAPSRRPPNPRSPASESAPAEIEIPLIAELPGDRPPTSHSSSTIKEPQQQQQQRSPKSPRPHSPRSPQQQQLINPFSQIHIHTQQNNRPTSPAAPDDSPTISPTPQIVKRTSVSQRSERLSISSVHTIEPSQTRPSTTRNPTSGSLGAAFAPSERKPSDAGSGDTTTQNQTRSSGESKATSAVDLAAALGEKKLAKLKKKGINPELYLEMKAARGGKSRLVGPLVGNTYIG